LTTFALVHGAWHGSWCWERVTPLLEERGHRVVAVDLPSDDVRATFETYADVVVTALDGVGADVVVVGHSLAGQTIPLVADRRPVHKLIYLCALVATPGLSFAEQLTLEPDTLLPEYRSGLQLDEEGRSVWVDELVARRALYADCSAADAEAAFERLRPQAAAPQTEPCPLRDYPPVAATYVVCFEDRIVNPDRGRNVARDRLRAELVELPGSHSPFMSRPRDLAELLHRQAEQ
jgi:pimeloyl-ACP methyl ester carboxylesterase